MQILERLVNRAFAARNVDRLKLTPRDYQDKMTELVTDAVEIEASVCAEQMYVWELPRVFTPDSWRKVIEMMNEGVTLRDDKGIEILSPPKGPPPQIAEGWIGATIPFSSDIFAPPMVFVTPELSEEGMTSVDGRCYVVSSPMAVSVLEAHNPQVVDMFKEFMPDWDHKNQVLIFDSDCCEVVELT